MGFNQATKEMHDESRKELSHVTNKLKQACGSEIVEFEDLVGIKYGPDSEVMKAFTSSAINMFKKTMKNVSNS